MKMLRRVLVRRRVTAPHMPALHTHPQMDPRAANLQTILATPSRRLHLMYLVQMGTFHGSTFLRPDSIPSVTKPAGRATSGSSVMGFRIGKRNRKSIPVPNRQLAFHLVDQLAGESPRPSVIPYSFSFLYSVVFPIPSSFAAINLSPFSCRIVPRIACFSISAIDAISPPPVLIPSLRSSPSSSVVRTAGARCR